MATVADGTHPGSYWNAFLFSISPTKHVCQWPHKKWSYKFFTSSQMTTEITPALVPYWINMVAPVRVLEWQTTLVTIARQLRSTKILVLLTEVFLHHLCQRILVSSWVCVSYTSGRWSWLIHSDASLGSDNIYLEILAVKHLHLVTWNVKGGFTI